MANDTRKVDEDDRLQTLLSQLGFTENETSLYLHLADLTKASPASLAKRTGIPRTTVYSVANSLIEKGLVSHEEHQGGSSYEINQPEALLRLVQKEMNVVKAKEQIVREAIPLITPHIKGRDSSIPKVRFFDGRKNVESMLYDWTSVWQESVYKYDYTWWGYQDHTFVEKYRGWLESVWQSMHERELVYLFSNEVPLEKELRGQVKNRIIKAIPSEFQFLSTIWILGDYIVFIMSRDERDYAFQIHAEVFAGNLRMVCKLLWETLPFLGTGRTV